ncbi:MAG: hypothetical protein JWM95_4686 [Gemmatimonadetes bacterium]|nr:hypothetical protein [Gemmatimonadota bacterium]
MAVRALQSSDAVAARALVERHLGGTRYHPRTCEQLELALVARHGEDAGLALGDMSGVLLYGTVAGAAGVVRIHTAIGNGLASLLEGMLASEPARSARLVVCELASDVIFAPLLHALLTFGFLRGGTVEDYFEHGVSLEILVLYRHTS